jgi:hypothetical protein
MVAGGVWTKNLIMRDGYHGFLVFYIMTGRCLDSKHQCLIKRLEDDIILYLVESNMPDFFQEFYDSGFINFQHLDELCDSTLCLMDMRGDQDSSSFAYLTYIGKLCKVTVGAPGVYGDNQSLSYYRILMAIAYINEYLKKVHNDTNTGLYI